MVPYPQHPMPMQPPPKKGMSGCMIALLVVGIVTAVFCIVGAVGIYLFATSSVGKTAIKVMQEGPKLAEKSLNAPGTPELRAMGCDQALVLDTKDVGDLMSDLFDGGFDAGVNMLVVTCQVRDPARAPKCDDVATTYVTAVGAAKSEFMVTVEQQGGNHPICQSTYDEDGTLLHTGGI